MALKWIDFNDWVPDSGHSLDTGVPAGIVGGDGVFSARNLTPGKYGYSGIGLYGKISNGPGGGLGGTADALTTIMWHPAHNLIYTGETNIRMIRSSTTAGVWTDRMAAPANGDYHLMPWGNDTLAVGGHSFRMRSATGSAGLFANITTNISPKYIARFQNRVFVANCAWSGITGVPWTSPDPDIVWASVTDNPLIFDTIQNRPADRTTFWALKDQYGPITGIAATESYVLVVKQAALIIGRPTSSYDMDWSYLAYYGGEQPRSIVVSGEDIYLWTLRGPVVIKNGDEAIQLGSDRIHWTMSNNLVFDNSQWLMLASNTIPARVYGVQDMGSGIVSWFYNHAEDTVTRLPLDRAIHYDPGSDKFSWSHHEYAYSQAGALNAFNIGCVGSLPYVLPEQTGYQRHTLSQMLMWVSDVGAGQVGSVWRFVDVSSATAWYRSAQPPRISTHWFASDDGGMASIKSVTLPFASMADLAATSVTLQVIQDRADGAITSYTYSGLDAGGRIDLSSSPSAQLFKLSVNLADDGSKLSNAYTIRNWKGMEIDLVSTYDAGV